MTLFPLRAAVLGAGLAIAAAAGAGPAVAGPVLLAQLSDSDIAVRMNRLEEQNRQLTGQVEELQHQVQVLSRQVSQMQGAAGAPVGGGGTPPASAPPRVPPAGPAYGGGGGYGGAGDDNGILAPSGPGETGHAGPGAPLVIAPNLGTPAAPPPSSGPAPGYGGTAPRQAPPAGAGGNAALPAPPSNKPGDSYALAKGYLERRNYEDAELQFKDFLATFPKDRLVGDALYGLGESYFLRHRYNDALEPFLKVVTDHSSSSRAPDAMVRLGETLNAIDQKSQACATFNALAKKFPRATEAKAKAAREMKEDGC
jgi:tol-pal system protein YbgF